MNREVHVRFWERPGVKVLRATRHARKNSGGAYRVRFSNRPFEVKHFQTVRHCSVDVAHGLVLLFGIGAGALPSWDSRMR